METGNVDFTEVALRLVGAFYAFAGFVAVRAALMSHLLDHAIAAITAKKPSRIETARNAWLLSMAIMILVGGVMLMLLLGVAAWVFLASALAQALYLYVLAPRWLDAEDAPDARGRRQSTNAFFLFSAATAFVLWASITGRLLRLDQVPWPILAGAVAAVAAYLVRSLWLSMRSARSPTGAMLGSADDDPSEDAGPPSTSQRIKLMAEVDAHPLWALDGAYGDFPPEELDLSPALTQDINAWAEVYNSSFNRDDPAASRWSEEQHRAHAEQGRLLAIRLARERPDRTVFIPQGDTGVVEVRGDETA